MKINIRKSFKRYIEDQVKAGRFSTKDRVVIEALEHFKLRDPLLGLFADEPELMDEIVEAAMRDREIRSLRFPTEE